MTSVPPLQPALIPGRLRTTLFLLLITSVFVAAISRQSVAVLVAPIKSAFGANDTAIGFYQGVAFFVPAAIAAFPIGILIDRADRLKLINIFMVAICGSLVGSAFSQGFWQLCLCRMCAGVAYGGLMTAVYPLVSDLYQLRARQTAMVMVLVSLNIGNGAAFYLAGGFMQFAVTHEEYFRVGEYSISPWRVTYVLCAVPILVISVLLFTFKLPHEHRDAARSPLNKSGVPLGSFLKENLLTICLLFGGLVGAENSIDLTLSWAESVLGRRFGWSTGHASSLLGLTVSTASLGGLALAATLVGVLSRRLGGSAPAEICRYALAVSAVVFATLFVMPSGSAFLLAVGLLLMINYVSIGMTPNLTLSFPPPQLRGRFNSLYAIVMTVSGAFSPMVVGAMSDALHSERTGLALSYECVGTANAAISAVLFLAFVARLRRRRALETQGKSLGAGVPST